MRAHPFTVSLMLIALVVPVADAQQPASPLPAAPSAAKPLPPIHFAGALAGDELLTRLKTDARYAFLSKDVIGSPIALRVSHTDTPTAGGKAAGLASAILAGGTLGLLPMVTSAELVVTYEINVNGTPLTSYTYQKTFTRSQNIYSTDTTYGLGKDGFEWAKSTVEQFLADSANDPKLADLVREYEFYFGPVKAP